MSRREELDKKALYFAETYGILDYSIKGSIMIFYRNYPKYLNNPAYTVKHMIDLVTMNETTQILKRKRPK